ncbi:recombinase family protein [Sphingobium sp. MI1205]|uniref:recombinase family protein n=1 Tax=Sphingobium sp. MI1205 TaxID=407020 RepID=UPI000770178F|nr:recombinase family protein [Sphingobium sp. MI1205]AMK18740.1 recombinase [Sphingobium sp. MI1205]
MRTVIYARFSSDNQNPRSTADQIALCRQRAEQEGWHVVATFEDAATSGAAGIDAHQRPGLHAMMQMVEAGGIDQVLAESTDRISRHIADAHMIRERIEFVGARLFTLFDGTVTPMIGLVKGFMDAQFRTDLAKRVRRGQLGTLKQGRIPGSIAYGYRHANRLDEKGQLVRGLREIDTEKADIVRRIFAEYAAGRSPRQIAARLTADGVPAPQGALWHETAISGDLKHKRGILRNETYIGVVTYGRSSQVVNPQTRQRLMRPNPEEAVERQAFPHLRIIDDHLWQQVQERLASNQGVRPERKRRPKHVLSGLGFCGVCGAAWVKASGDFWRCSNYRYRLGCSNNHMTNTRLYERGVLADLKAGLLSPDAITEYVREYHRDFARQSAELGRDRAKIERKLQEAERKMERMLKAFSEGGSEFAEIRTMLAAARDEKERLTRELASLDAMPNVLSLHPHIEQAYRNQVEELEKALAEPEAELEAVPRLRAMIARVIVHPDTERKRGVKVEVVRQMDEILSMAKGQQAQLR